MPRIGLRESPDFMRCPSTGRILLTDWGTLLANAAKEAVELNRAAPKKLNCITAIESLVIRRAKVWHPQMPDDDWVVEVI